MSPDDLAPRFARKIWVSPSGCWLWMGARNQRGYGNCKINGRVTQAHRYIYEFFIGPIPDGALLMHSCDTPACCCPEHLTPGTDALNARDMVEKGRSNRGERNGAAKLTAEAVREILTSGRSPCELADAYGVTARCIRFVLDGVTWSHVTA